MEPTFLDTLDPAYDRGLHVRHREARQRAWYATTPVGLFFLGYDDVHWLLRDARFRELGADALDAVGIQDGPLWEWFHQIVSNKEGAAHTRLRKLVSRAFTPRRAEALRPLMRATARDLVDRFRSDGAIEFVSAFAAPYPVRVISALLGVPDADFERFHAWSRDLSLAFGSRIAQERPRIEAALTSLSDYVDDLVAERRKVPRDDLTSALIAAEEAGDRLSAVELRAMITVLIFGGQDTTQCQLACAAHAFAAHPAEWARLAAEPALAASATEEVLRYEPAGSGSPRVATEDLEYRGLAIAKGTVVMPSAPAANRDPAVYPAPDRFDITREPLRPMLTFGGGAHYCLGASLARAEIQEALGVLSAAFPGLALDGEPEWRVGALIPRPRNPARPVREHVMTATDPALLHFDPFDPGWFDDPVPGLSRAARSSARSRGGTMPRPACGRGYWMLTRSDDIEAVLQDWRTFSSARGTLIDTDISLIPPNMFNMDPPRHDELRAILARVLTPKRVAELEPRLRAQTRGVVEAMAAGGRADAATDLGQIVPTLTMCELMDLPVDDRERFLKWNLDTLAGADFTSPAALTAYEEMGAYWQALVADRRGGRGSDLISQIVNYAGDGETLSDAEVAGFCSLLHDASQNTTMNMIAGGVLALGAFPDERRKVGAAPERWPRALEELLRFVSPVQGLARCATPRCRHARRDDPRGRPGARALRRRQPRPRRLRGSRASGLRAGRAFPLDLRKRYPFLPRECGRPARGPRRPRDLPGPHSGFRRGGSRGRTQPARSDARHRARAHHVRLARPREAPMADQPVDEAHAFDPSDPAQAKDFARMARIRRDKPVCRPAPGVVVTTEHEATKQAFLDAKRLSSVGDMRAPGVVVPEAESFLGELDAPLHPKIRRILLKGFTRGGARAAEPWTRAAVARRLEATLAAGAGDLMADLAIPLPGSVSAHVLGVDDDLHEPVMNWCNALLHSTWPATGRTERGEGIAECFPELAHTLDSLIEARQAKDHGDLLSIMVRTRDDEGWSIPPHHVRTLCVNILAGSLSASFMIGNLLHRLLTEPPFARTLREDAGAIPLAVEETLRLEAPVTFLFRTAREAAEIGGCPVHAGEHVMLHIAAANRDDAVYAEADTFRLDRTGAPEHLSFGFGPHVCIGNHLTRMIGAVVLEEWLGRVPEGALRLAPGFRWECVAHLQEYGPERLEVVATTRGG